MNSERTSRRGAQAPHRRPAQQSGRSVHSTPRQTRTMQPDSRGSGARPPGNTRPPLPRRPSAKVLRRRRIAALILLLLLTTAVIASGWALKERFSPSASPDPTPATEEPTGPTEEDLANPKDCVPSALEVRVDLAVDSLAAGKPVDLPVTVRNGGDVPCLVDVGSSAVELMIASGTDTVWTSAHCPGDVPKERPLLLAAQAEDTTVFAWNGHRSSPDCPGGQPVAKPGTYRMMADVALESGSQQSEDRVLGVH